MLSSVEDIFPEITDPEFIKKREKDWELALTVGDWKSKYRKKDLEKIKAYFFTGAYDQDNPIATYRGSLLKMFPIQSPKGYDFFYENHEFLKESLEEIAVSSTGVASQNGMDEAAQLAYFDYHLGETFKPTVTRYCKNGAIEVSLKSRNIAMNIFAGISDYCDNMDKSEKFYSERIPYYFSVLPYVDSSEIFRSKLNDDYYFKFFKSIVSKKFKGRKRKNDDRYRVADEFTHLVESTEGLPEKFVQLWQQAKDECQNT